MAQPGWRLARPATEQGTAMIATAATPLAEPGGCHGPTSMQLAWPHQGRAPPGLVTSCRSQRRCSSGRDDDTGVTAGQTAIVRWILPLKMPLAGRTLTRF